MLGLVCGAGIAENVALDSNADINLVTPLFDSQWASLFCPDVTA